MQLTAAFATLLLAIPTALSASVTYDNVYDDASGSMNSVACSNGPNGLASRWPTFGNVPNFPYIGGASAVTGWNSPNCGSCWELSFTQPSGKTNTIHIVAVDYVASGFNIAQKAMDNLTNGHAVEYGVVDISSKRVDGKLCGLR